MNPEELQAWAESQIQALMAAGVDPIDAQATIARVLAQLPEGADPNIWVPTIEQMDTPIDSEAAIADARQDWYTHTGAKYARLLDAAPVEK